MLRQHSWRPRKLRKESGEGGEGRGDGEEQGRLLLRELCEKRVGDIMDGNGVPVAATAAATAWRAAGLDAALPGLAGTPTNAGVEEADPGASPAAATAWALEAGPVSAEVFLRLPDMLMRA